MEAVNFYYYLLLLFGLVFPCRRKSTANSVGRGSIMKEFGTLSEIE